LDPALLDRLVDGELAEVERRKLLVSLDQRPSGWRQCALAFLEAQSWRDLLGVAVDEPTRAPMEATVAEPSQMSALESAPSPAPCESPPLVVPASTTRRQSRSRRWLWVGEMAASFLVAFSLGLWLRGGFTTTTSTTPPGDNGATRAVEMVVQGAGGKTQTMQVPVLPSSRAGWWQSQPAASIPDDVRRAVERAGGRIRQVRKYFPVELPDGSRAVVPIDQIDVEPAGNQGMQ
jgi:hypothetical protein